MLFGFQIFVDFLEIFVIYSEFNFIMVREYTLYDLNTFQFMKSCFIAQNIDYIG